MNRRVTQAEADQAAASAAAFWPAIGQRWSWTRQVALAPTYHRAGEVIIALLRTLPAIQWSNQARWYQRSVRDTPAVLVFPADAFEAEVMAAAGADERATISGKMVVSLVFPVDETQPGAGSDVAKTLLVSTDASAPSGVPQLAHEILTCFCATEWDSQTLRCGLRLTSWETGARADRFTALHDFTLDAALIHALPALGVNPDTLLTGALGPYWSLARTYAQRLRGVPTLPALFAPQRPDENPLERFQQSLAVALDTPNVAALIDRLVATHDWPALTDLLGAAG